MGYKKNLGATPTNVPLILNEEDRERVRGFIDHTLDDLLAHELPTMNERQKNRMMTMADTLLALRLRFVGEKYTPKPQEESDAQ